MKIGIDARMLGSAPGIGRYIEQLTRELFRLDQENEYVLFLREPAYSSYELPRESMSHLRTAARIRKVRAPERWYSFAEQISFPFRIARERLDLFFAPQFNVPLVMPCPFVVTIHDVTQLYVPGPLQRRSLLRRRAFLAVFSQAVRRARAVIAVSEYTKAEMVKHFRIPPEKIRVIYEGPGLRPNPDDDVTGSILSFQSPYIFSVGVWRSHKNFTGLIDAFALLKKRADFVSLRLVLAGEEDPRYPEIRERIRRSGFATDIIAPGPLTDMQLDRWYRFARAVVVPSFYEGFGFVGLEALSRRVPVVASRAAALPEILGDAASYCDPHDPSDIAAAIARVLTDAEERERILAAAPSILERYSWEKAAAATLEVFKRANGTIQNKSQ